MHNKIKSEDISVVVQGAVSKEYTKTVLKSIRKYLPKAEIILSTWEGSKVEELDYNIIVFNEDPGAEMLFPQWNQRHNLNRQIVSTKNGLKKATRKYVLKIRTDISLTSNSFLKYFGKFNKRCNELKLLNERVLITRFYARHPEIFPLHISDWVFFGLKEDVENIWNIPLAPEPDTTYYFNNHPLLPQHNDINSPYNHFRHRYCAEQYIWINFLKRNGINVNMEHMWDITYENIALTKISFANNLVILGDKQYGIKYLKSQVSPEPDTYNYEEWQQLYKQYCDIDYITDTSNNIFDEAKFVKFYGKFRKHLNKTKASFISIIRLIPELISTFYYGIKSLLRIFSNSLYLENIDKKDKTYLDNLLKQIPENIKKINLLNLATGESYIFANIFSQIVGNDEVLWCTTRKSTYEIFQMFAPGKIVFLNENKKHYFKKSQYYYKNKDINIFLGDDFWFEFWKTKNSFVEALPMYLNKHVSLNFEIKPEISKDIETSLEEKIKQIGLNLANFVILSPEASSTNLLPEGFWTDITQKLKQNNIDVFVNITNSNNRIKNTKDCYLNFQESYLLAQKAKAVIGLRSGFMEIISSINVPMFVIYNMNNNKANKFIVNLFENYTLQKYPDVTNKLFEYKNISDKDLDFISQSIIKELDNLLIKEIK